MPATGAGLIRFYSESDSPGIKVGPVMSVVMAVGLILVISVFHIFGNEILSFFG
jgi:preprotein translocase subunit Sec61beta